MNVTWTAEAEKTLRELWPDPKMSCAMIAERMDVTRNMVIGKARRLGLGPKVSDHAKTNTRLKHPPPKPKVFKPKPKRNFGGVWNNYPGITEPYTPRTIEASPTLSKSILSVAGEECRWPTHEDAETGGHRFCGHPSANGKPYCEAHCRLAYVQPKERSEAQRANDLRMAERARRQTNHNEKTKWMAEEAA